MTKRFDLLTSISGLLSTHDNKARKLPTHLTQLMLAAVIGGFTLVTLLLWFTASAQEVQAAPPARRLVEEAGGTVTWNLASTKSGVPALTTLAGGISDTVTINDPAQLFDTWIDGRDPTFNNGACTTLATDRENGGENRILIRFDLSSIPAGATITSAQLRLTNIAGNYSMNNAVYRATSDWSEGAACGSAGAANWTQRQTGTNWTSTGGDFAATPLATVDVTAAGQYSWDVTSAVTGWWNSTFPNFGLVVFSPDGGGNRVQTWASSENATAANRPQLVVAYTTPAEPDTTTTLSAAPSLVTSGETITVTMTLTASETITNVSPSALTITATNGVSASLVSGPTPVSATVSLTGTAFTWVYHSSDSGSVGYLTFSGEGSDGSTNWPWAESNRVIVITSARDLIDKQVTPAIAAPADTLTYTIAVTYPGSSLLSNATVTDTVPSGTTYLPSSANAGGSESGGLVTWSLGNNTAGTPGSTPATAMCPASLTLTADADTWIYAKTGSENLNYGADTRVRTTSKAGEEQYGLVHFNVTSGTLPAGAALQGAILQITNDDNNSNRTTEIRELLTAWTEGNQNGVGCTTGATWSAPNCSDNWAGGGVFSSADYGTTNYGTIRPANSDLTHYIDVTSPAQTWVTGADNNGLLLLANGSDTNEIKWYTRQDATVSYRPQLTLNYLVPTPGGCSGSETLNPIADTYIREDSPTENFELGTGERIHIQPEATKQRISLVRFDLSSIPLGATITSGSFAMLMDISSGM